MITTNYSTTKKLEEIERGFAFANHAVNGDASHTAPFIQKWEYCIIEIHAIHSDQDREERVDELHKLGTDGWELAGTTSGGSQYHEYLIFKRPKILDTETYFTKVPQSVVDDELNIGERLLG